MLLPEPKTSSRHIERFNRTLREEALNHFIFLGVDHIRRVIVSDQDNYALLLVSSWAFPEVPT
ncbi:MAG: transposase [Candidatus Eisenbacteria bacterium]|uniref:Transposase n=1 Tax=Eiseniibacteriota bacterium TaxID=2212470 RepID=A0A948W5J8_UNCEI|nr:transposase [Candidatus Eisenbacteria bacterium]MBU1947429.1 transposase [Candidatus Eisenbacteria bacterium]MBU2693382.1 transposase [Candidatus Eisenbacteria bacterium]